ncbi:MAG: ATPase domain-containing protein [Thermoplasmata archaeon]
MVGNSQGKSTDKKKSSSSLDGTLSKSQQALKDQLCDFEYIDESTADVFIESGYKSLKSIRDSSITELMDNVGLDEQQAKKIKVETRDFLKQEDKNVGEGGDELEQWLTGETEKGLGGVLDEDIESAKGQDPLTEESSTEEDDVNALKSWLSGEEESFSEWLGEKSFEEEKKELEEELEDRKDKIERKENELESEERELEDLKNTFQEKLEKIETGEFDPQELIEENAELKEKINQKQEELEELEEEKENIEEEIDDIKQGSVAMVKYLKSQLKQQQGEVSEVFKKENEELKEEIEKLKSREPVGEIEDSEVQESLDNLNEELEEKEEEIRDLKEEIKFKEETINDLKEKLEYKQEELNQREEDLQYREKKLRKEKQELESLREEYGDTTEKERKRQLEDLRSEIDRKEQELKAKEKYIDQKEKELRAREEDLIDEELEERQEEILKEIEQEKCKTGTTRLDDLLLGGIPLGSNVSIYGPPHVGKEILVNSFVAEGLEKGVPAIWVITDKTVEDIQEEMKYMLPTYEEYEMRGLVYYVDAYSVSMGEVEESERDKDYITYVEDQSDVKKITEAVDKYANQLKDDHRYYRMAFESVSTIIAYLDTATTFRILQPFAGRRKKDNAVSLFTLEKGMHTEQDISMLGHIMDGEINFKVQQLQNYLRVEGLGDVQTRDWVKYQASKTGITMGSFSLDTIR